MRDSIKSITYFKEYIEEEEKRIAKFQTKLDSGEVKVDRIVPVKEKVLSLKFQVMIAKYSMGESIEEIRKEYNTILPEASKYWYFDLYSNTVWMLSLAILLDTDVAEIDDFLVEVRKRYSNDWLISFLISYFNNSEEVKNKAVLFEKPYKKLQRIVETVSDSDKIDKIKNYLEKEWYKGHKDSGWYEMHKSKEKLYYGYWSFESAAIVKILGLNDDVLEKVSYYPYDLVHQEA